jgi:hypothetical protein
MDNGFAISIILWKIYPITFSLPILSLFWKGSSFIGLFKVMSACLRISMFNRSLGKREELLFWVNISRYDGSLNSDLSHGVLATTRPTLSYDVKRSDRHIGYNSVAHIDDPSSATPGFTSLSDISYGTCHQGHSRTRRDGIPKAESIQGS